MYRLPLAILLLCIALPLAAQADAPDGYRGEVLRELAEQEERLLELAREIPGDTYDWRPADGVRSIREALLHVADANYFMPTLIGVEAPDGFRPGQLESSVGEKVEVIDQLRQSFAHLRQAVLDTPDAELGETTRWLGGGENTVRGVLLFIPKHIGEHQGQLIAYARTNGVVPPWSQ